MRLRTKKVLIFSATISGLLLVSYAVSRMVIVDSYRKLQEEDVRLNLGRASQALSDDVANLTRTAADYAMWDDTYAFMGGANPGYVDTQLSDEGFLRLRVNSVLIFDTSHRIVVGKSIGRKNERPMELASYGSSSPGYFKDDRGTKTPGPFVPSPSPTLLT